MICHTVCHLFMQIPLPDGYPKDRGILIYYPIYAMKMVKNAIILPSSYSPSSIFHVHAPMIPSQVFEPFAFWNAFTAASNFGPNSLSDAGIVPL